MSPKRKRIDRQQLHSELMRTDANYRRLGELIDSRRTPAEREAFPLGSEAFSREVDRKLREQIESYEDKRRRASS